MIRRLWIYIPLINQAASRLLYQKGSDTPNQELNVTYSPARPPAIPLAVRSPYASIWSTTANGNSLNTREVTFWNGQEVGWEGIITVDGISYEYLGAGFRDFPASGQVTVESAIASRVEYDSSESVFTLTAGPVEVKASFLSPVLPDDLCRSSVPLSYLNTSFRSLDGMPHDIQLYADISSTMLAPEGDLAEGILMTDPGQANSSDILPDEVSFWYVNRLRSLTFSESNDFARWGSLVHGTNQGNAANFSYQSGYSEAVRSQYIANHTLSFNSSLPYPITQSKRLGNPVFAFSHDYGTSESGSALYTVGNIQHPVISYIATTGLAQLDPWWTQCQIADAGVWAMIGNHFRDYNESRTKALHWDLNLKADIDSYFNDSSVEVARDMSAMASDTVNPTSNATNGTDQFGVSYNFDPDNAFGWLDHNSSGIAVPDVSELQSYYAVVALSARQIMGAYVLTTRPGVEPKTRKSTEPMMFQKEISSNGNVNTVDVMYPAMPFFLYANPNLLRYVMDPLFDYQEDKFYPNLYSIHDLGHHFPNATGHLDGDDEAMQVEECGNMLIMTYAVFKFTDDALKGKEYLSKHLPVLAQWAKFLEINALVPDSQLSTDDFAGNLVNQTNLAIKGILGLQAMSLISSAVNNTASNNTAFNVTGTAESWGNLAKSYFSQWEDMAIDPSGQHTMLSYQHRASWGTLYNIYPDKLLNLSIVPQSIYDMQSDWYPKVSQIFGVPLDSRDSQTKSDWEMWAAAVSQPSTRRLFINSLAYWLNHTEIETPFSDLFMTIGRGGKPDKISTNFMARPVVGGHYSLLAMLKAERLGLWKSGAED